MIGRTLGHIPLYLFFGAALIAVSFQGKSAPMLRPDFSGELIRKPIPPFRFDYRPEWTNISPEAWGPNVSLLGDRDFQERSFNLNDWMDPTRVKQLRQSYEDLRRDYELRQEYHLAGQDLEIGQVNRSRELSQKLVDEMRNYQIDRNQAKLMKRADNEFDLTARKKKLESTFASVRESKSPVTKVAMAVAGAAAVSTGTEVKADLGRDFHLLNATNVPYRVAYLKLISPVINSTITYAGDAPGSINPYIPGPPGWLKRDERYTLSLNRSILLDTLLASVTYSGTSDTVSGGLLKPLTPNLVAVYESTMPLDPQRAVQSTHSIKVNYEKHF